MTDPGSKSVTPKLSTQTYDVLKFIAQILLPALATLYFAIAGLWTLPYVTQVIGTIAALDVFLGVLLGINTQAYNKSGRSNDGALVVDTSDTEKDVYSLELTTPFEELHGRDSITLKVSKPNLPVKKVRARVKPRSE